jgi:predicted benzoate:H+ symporter BenE
MRLIPLPLASALLAAVLLRLAIDSLAKGLQEAMIWPVLSLWFGFFLVRRIWPSAAIFVVLFMGDSLVLVV